MLKVILEVGKSKIDKELESYAKINELNGTLLDYWFEDDTLMEKLNGKLDSLVDLTGIINLVDAYKNDFSADLIINLLEVMEYDAWEVADEILREDDFHYFSFEEKTPNRHVEIAMTYLEKYTNIDSIPTILGKCIDYKKVVHELKLNDWLIGSSYAFKLD